MTALLYWVPRQLHTNYHSNRHPSISSRDLDTYSQIKHKYLENQVYLTLKNHLSDYNSIQIIHISRRMEPRDVSLATITSDLKDFNTLPIESTTNGYH